MNGYSIPKATLGRLPIYLEYLRSKSESHTTISATSIAKGLSLGDVQVRKDLASVSGAGKPKIGYEIDALMKRIEECLGVAEITPAVLVGAGKLGKALFDFDGFKDFGVDVIAAFDCNNEAVSFGKQGKQILPIGTFEEFCKARNVKIGIITVGAGSAQIVCDTMIKSGIKAIWNFAPCRLEVPSDIIVKQENLALSLAHLNNQISK